MSSLNVFNFKGQEIRLQQRGDRVWICITDMAIATDRLVTDWMHLKSTIEYISCLNNHMGFPVININTGYAKSNTDTWALDEVAIDFAAWCSVEFRIWANQQINKF